MAKPTKFTSLDSNAGVSMNGAGTNALCVATNGTTAVNVIDNLGASGNVTITGVVVVSKDTTAGNILVKNGANTVATVAKGTTAGALVGATTLSNAAILKGAVFTVESSSAGDAYVIIYFKPTDRS